MNDLDWLYSTVKIFSDIPDSKLASLFTEDLYNWACMREAQGKDWDIWQILFESIEASTPIKEPTTAEEVFQIIEKPFWWPKNGSDWTALLLYKQKGVK